MPDFLTSLPWALFFTRLVLLPIVFTVHEAAHALAATVLGDPTPRAEGRLSLNPRRHWEYIGMLLGVLIGVGWSRPVHFQAHKMRVPDALGGVITVIAGPLANAVCILVGLALMDWLDLTRSIPLRAFPTAAQWLTVWVRLNLAVLLINLPPLFPLDGFALIAAVLPLRLLARWQALAGKTTLVLGIGLVFVMLMPVAWMHLFYWPVLRAANGLLGW